MCKYKYQRTFPLAFCLALGALLSLALGQDTSWDLRNYHLYNPFAALHERFGLDFFIADKQTGLNPTVDFPYMFLALGPLANYPRVLAALMGLPYGFMVFVVWNISKILLARFEAKEKLPLAILATTTAVTGAMTIAQTGSTSNDVTIGMFVLAGLWTILRDTNGWGSFVIAGLLFGAAAGLKLTGGIYAPALVVSLFVSLPLRRGLRASSLFSLGWLLGFMACYGWWGWKMWVLYGNPAFPLFNDLFHSAMAPAQSLRDMRFLPRNAAQWIVYPFYWAFNADNQTVFESGFRDPRMAIAYSAIIVFAIKKRHVLFAKKRTRHNRYSAKNSCLFFGVLLYRMADHNIHFTLRHSN